MHSKQQIDTLDSQTDRQKDSSFNIWIVRYIGEKLAWEICNYLDRSLKYKKDFVKTNINKNIS